MRQRSVGTAKMFSGTLLWGTFFWELDALSKVVSPGTTCEILLSLADMM